MLTLFAGDLHLGSNNVVKFRNQFKTVEEHDQTIVNNIMECLNKRSLLYLLGDVCMSAEALAYIDMFRSTGARVVLIGGNHCTDKVSMQMLSSAFDDVLFYKNKYGMTMSHMPIHPQQLRGKLNLHAHTHDSIITDSRYLCVSLEQINYKPISIEQVREVFLARMRVHLLSPDYAQQLRLE
jgi:calcineurin-like phosphoesterase family protein